MGTILLGIAMFMFLVIIHELGHFYTAKKSGVKVEEFGIGIPPKVIKVAEDKSGTEYTINWIPLGGFVRLKGDGATDESFRAKDSLMQAKFRNKILILSGGVIVNTLFAWLAFSFAFWQGVYPLTVVPENVIPYENTSYLMPTYSRLEDAGFLKTGEESTVSVQEVLPDSLAEQAGLRADDVLVSIDGKEVRIDSISETLQSAIGTDIDLTIRRGVNEMKKTLTCPDDNCFLGIKMGGGYQIQKIQFPFLQSFYMGGYEIVAQTKLTFSALGNLFGSLFSFNREKIGTSVDKLSGPVGIVKFGEYVWNSGGFVSYLAFAGMISLALAIFNVLPIPALDGGRMLGVIIQKVGKFKEEAYYIIENYINVIFFVLLMILGIYIILQDLSRSRGVNIPFFS